MPAYRISIDREACDGIFACLTRDERFIEDADGLATIEADDVDALSETDAEVVAAVEDDRIEDARQAAAACPPGAITVEEVEECP